MFENFSKFFAEKKNIHIFIAALVILGGILTLKRIGLYEGMSPDTGSSDTGSSDTGSSDTGSSTPTEVNKTPGTVKRQ